VLICCRLYAAKKKKRKKSGNVGGVDGQIGRYVRGVQVIASKDLKRVHSKIASKSRQD